ncbi:MAG: phosphoribosylanthranilate isomerase [Synechocystis sp.]|nr:phosphoribosylanthranilate isomerase [Synechocystis sp.]
MTMQVKICGLKSPPQAQAIAALGFRTFGFICVESSPRYVTPDQIQQVLNALVTVNDVAAIGVFANLNLSQLATVLNKTPLTGIQLHGDETPKFCQQVKHHFPDHQLIKALRLRQIEDLKLAECYFDRVDVLLLDAYHPQQLGGTGKTLPWQHLHAFRPPIPWWLAGGLTPQNLPQALETLRPDGIDLSSGIELAPADKDIEKVQQLRTQLEHVSIPWR